MTYKAAILGCGPRAEAHILAFDGLEEIHLVAACDKNAERLNACGERFSIHSLYGDLGEMLDSEKPDILHIVTPPAMREEPIELAGQAGVKGILVEKPIALAPAQAARICSIADEHSLKIAVNTQRRYFETVQSLKNILDQETIGDIEFIRCVARGNVLSMGPHVVDLLLYLLDDAEPEQVWATAYGWNGEEWGHPAPANVLATVVFPGRIVAYLEDSEDAVGHAGEEDVDWRTYAYWQHLDINIWASNGRAWWSQDRKWGYQSHDMRVPRVEKMSWSESDVPGQREFTRAMARWLDDDRNMHMNCLDNSMRGFNLIMGIFHAVLEQRRITLPVTVPDNITNRLEKRLR